MGDRKNARIWYPRHSRVSALSKRARTEEAPHFSWRELGFLRRWIGTAKSTGGKTVVACLWRTDSRSIPPPIRLAIVVFTVNRQHGYFLYRIRGIFVRHLLIRTVICFVAPLNALLFGIGYIRCGISKRKQKDHFILLVPCIGFSSVLFY